MSKGNVCAANGSLSDGLSASSSDSSADSSTDSSTDRLPESLDDPHMADPPTVVIEDTMAQLVRRPTHDEAKHVVMRMPVTRSQRRCDPKNTYKLHEVQDAFETYCAQLQDIYSIDFWRILSSVYRERAGVIDRVLKRTRDVFVPSRSEKKRFPATVRDIRAATLRECGNFPSYVLHEVTINVAEFDLPGDIQSVHFQFVNPLWAWVGAANEMIRHGHVMHFEPKRMVHEVRLLTCINSQEKVHTYI